MRLLKSELKKSQRILVSTHLLPDGDGLGAETALYHYLKGANKNCQVINPDPIPKRYQLLDPEAKFIHSIDHTEVEPPYDLWLIVDTHDPRRLGGMWQKYSPLFKKIIFLDHHPPTHHQGLPIQYPANAWVISDPKSSSIGELLYRVFQELKLTPMNPPIALGLYVSIMTDTNSFRYSRTTPLSHRIASETLQFGVNPEEVVQSIFSSKEVSHVQLLGETLSNVKTAAQNRIAWLELPLELRKKYGASSDDTLSFINFLLLIKDAEVIVLFREEENGTTRVSLRSKGKLVVNSVAMSLGGGGHEFSAGAALPCRLDQAVPQVIGPLEKLMKITTGDLTSFG